MKEQWRDIAGFDGKYRVSNLGNILSVKRNIILKSREDKKKGKGC